MCKQSYTLLVHVENIKKKKKPLKKKASFKDLCNYVRIQKIFFRGGREGSELKVGRGPTLIIRNRDKQKKKPKNHEIPNPRGEDCRRGHNCDNFTL